MTGWHTEKQCSGKRKKTNIFKVELNEPGFWWQYYDEMSKMLKCAFCSGEESALIGNVYFKKNISDNNNHTQIWATKQRKQPYKAQIDVVSNKVLRFY